MCDVVIIMMVVFCLILFFCLNCVVVNKEERFVAETFWVIA